VRPIEERAASVAAGLLSSPESTRELTQTTPLGGPRQLALLKSQANQIADLATTLSGLAFLKAGEYERAAWSLGQIESPTADQRFYLALAHFRQGDTAEAGRILTEVVEQDPSHVGARLAMLMIRSEDPLWSTPDSELIGRLKADLTSEPTDTNLLRLFNLSIALLHTEQDDEAIVGFMELVDRFCKDERFEELPGEDRLLLIPIVLLTGMGSEGPTVDEAMGHLLRNEALDGLLASQPGVIEFMCAAGQPSPRCDGWAPDPYEADPFIYGWFHMERGDASLAEPEALLSVASDDPRLESNVADWLIMAHEGDLDAVLEWSGKHRAKGKELGRQYLVEGICLQRAGAFGRAEEAYSRAFEILEQTWSIEYFRGTNLMAAGRFGEAIEVLENTESRHLALALAATGRLRDAYRLLARRDAPDTGNEADSQPGSLEDSPPEELVPFLTGLVRSADSDRLAAVMDSMAREIEDSDVVLGAVSRRLRREVAGASDLSEGFTIHRGWSFSVEEGVSWETSWLPDLPYELPRDPLALLSFLESLPQSEEDTDQPIAREEVAALTRHLSVVLRDEVERLDPQAVEP
jgi:tetratricopeptide (TPR) repeat protein